MTPGSSAPPSTGRRRWLLLGALAGVAVLAVVVFALAGGDDGGGGDERAERTPKPAKALSSRTDLRPPNVNVFERSPEASPGLMLVAPKKVFGAKRVPGEQQGPMLVDDAGRVRWFKPMPEGQTAYDFRVQRYRGEPVLTWWQGRALKGSGKGVGMIYDTRYRRVKRVETGSGADADIHEFLLTPKGTALMIIYESVPYDLRPVGGKAKDKIVEGVVREVDVESGEILFEWRGLEHLDIEESYEKIDKRYGDSWDYLHLNSVDVDTDGNLLLSARHTWAVYKIDRETGEVIWRLGGKRDDFGLSKEERFAWQHDARAEEPGTVRIFDNAAASEPVRPQSRVITFELDPRRDRAELVKTIEHPRALSSGTQANAQLLPNGHTVVGWGSQGHFSEFGDDGELLFDARVQRGYDSYRAYRERWTGAPATTPAVSAERRGGRVVARASWNGATEVVRWQLLAGARRGRLAPVGEAAEWEGLETAVRARTRARYVAVRALDATGKALATSRAARVGAPR